jgi:hypothetical protein
MEVVNVKVEYIRPKYQNLKEWMADPDNIYIGRGRIVFIDGERFPKIGSPWANPYKTGDNIIERYREYIIKKINNKEVNLDDLRGKRLVYNFFNYIPI